MRKSPYFIRLSAWMPDIAWVRGHGGELGGASASNLRLTVRSVADVPTTRTLLSAALRRRVTIGELATLPFTVSVEHTAIPALRALFAATCCDVSFCLGELGDLHFYSVDDDFGELSNFALFPIRLGSRRWATTEHYFQAQKFKDPKDQSAVHAAKTPMIAARLGRDRKRKLRRDWESVKDSVMSAAVDAKFRQHVELRELLLSTGERRLVEHTANDAYWGDGGDGSGRNRLGEILMAVRTALGQEQ